MYNSYSNCLLILYNVVVKLIINSVYTVQRGMKGQNDHIVRENGFAQIKLRVVKRVHAMNIHIKKHEMTNERVIAVGMINAGIRQAGDFRRVATYTQRTQLRTYCQRREHFQMFKYAIKTYPC